MIRYDFILAWRNVWRNKNRSLIIMFSVVLGIWAGISVLSLYQGMLTARVRTVIDSEVAHLQIHRADFKNDYDANLTLSVDTIKSTIEKVLSIKYQAFRTLAPGMLSTPSGSFGVMIHGVKISDEINVSQLKLKVKEGVLPDSNKSNAILIGKKLADKMKVKVGGKLVLTFSDKDNNMTAGAFRVSGIYQTNNFPMDEINVYVHQITLNNYLNIGSGAHEVAIILNNDSDLVRAQALLQKEFPNLKVETWKQCSPETNLMVTTIDQYSLIIIIIIMLALAFGIINTMLMSVLERTHELGMLAALGMSKPKVFRLIIAETFILTLLGVPLGIGIAWLMIYRLSESGIDISSYSGAVMSGFGFSSIIYPEFPTDEIQSVLIVVLFTAMLAALIPAIRAVRLQPADALRL